MKKIKRIIQIAVYLLTFYFILRIFFKNWSTIQQAFGRIDLFDFFLSILLFFISFLLLSLVWYQMINRLGKISFVQSSCLYFKSQILRYIPGNIWGLGARIYFFNRANFKRTELFMALIYESMLLIFSGIIAYFIFKTSLSTPIYLDIGIGILGIIFLAFIIYPKVFSYLLNLLFHSEPVSFKISFSSLVIFIIQYLFYWIICGVGLYFLVISFTDFSAAKILTVVAIYSISWILGYISFITPSGMGVRELSLTLFLSQVVAMPLAGIIAIFARLVFITGELLNLGLSYLRGVKFRKNINSIKDASSGN